MDPAGGLVSWLQSNWPVIWNSRDRFDARRAGVNEAERVSGAGR